jgi:NitT/TauT family transport system ATP-binding protein
MLDSRMDHQAMNSSVARIVPKLALKGVTMAYGNERLARVVALSDVNLHLADREFLSIVGPSGCGKSTLLKLISGLEVPVGGSIELDGKLITGPTPGVGFMFQRDVLLPWMTVAQNIDLGHELSGVPRRERTARVLDLTRLLGLEGFEGHYPSALSGGMRQRVSLGRLLAYGPKVYLMDEPFGALDAQTKLMMGQELLRIWHTAQKSVVFVTHDIEEAVALSDRVIVMTGRPGRVSLEVKVDLPRPRDTWHVRRTPRFRELCDELWQELVDKDKASPAAH